ncbi:DUF3397 family protein [Planococcus lenghuensis]|uniref:DUF3397 domain-containing protein n=1 Tax=Planococcus lenghuensis TaxID=2213202 RepID=A0A1Q2L056_9BACL|nr:DUF3397 family protein [Planococcus lenghuensis]AQQ53803.1 hypothetical protein B0X71_12380 [Planococcus lenghuensis]
MDSWTIIGAFVIALPLPVYFFLRAKLIRRQRPTGKAADAATFLLFAAVPLSVEALWRLPFFSLTAIIAVATAIVMLYIEWKRTKEIDVFVYFRKTWRAYFLILFGIYASIWIAAAVWFTTGLFL